MPELSSEIASLTFGIVFQDGKWVVSVNQVARGGETETLHTRSHSSSMSALIDIERQIAHTINPRIP